MSSVPAWCTATYICIVYDNEAYTSDSSSQPADMCLLLDVQVYNMQAAAERK